VVPAVAWFEDGPGRVYPDRRFAMKKTWWKAAMLIGLGSLFQITGCVDAVIQRALVAVTFD
jgi:hypothetical protein